MKKIIISTAALLLLHAGFATNPPEVNEKTLDAFKKTFNEPQNVRWYENETTFEARFSNGGIKTVAWYNKDGDLLLTHRYYEQDKLPPFVLTNIHDQLPAYSIIGVTEISNKDGINYYITLESEKKWMKIRSDVNGDYEVYEKFKKG